MRLSDMPLTPAEPPRKPGVTGLERLERLERDNQALRARLQEAEDTLAALRGGEVDAIVVGADIYTLQSQEVEANRFRRDVLEQMGDAVVVLDASRHVVYLNPAAERQYGTTAAQALGLSVDELYLEQWPVASDEAAAAEALRQGTTWRGRTQHRGRHGTVLQVDVTRSLLRDAEGLVFGSLVVARDVSDKAAAEAALAESRARLQFALDSARIGDWELDLLTGAMRRSLRHDRCFGHDDAPRQWSLELALGQLHAADRDTVRHELQRAADGGGDAHLECRVHWADGSEHWLELHATLLLGADGGRRLVGTVAEITERKLAEAALRDADARKDVFLATLAHELRNPLAPVVNSMHVLRRTEEPALRARAVATIETQLRHLVRLLDDLLDVSRISRGHLELRRRSVELREVLDQAIDSVKPLLERKHHALALDLPADSVLLHGDPTRLVQVVSNLLHNAAKYTSDGGHIALGAHVHDGTLRISVEDNGLGIDADTLPHVFEIFIQGRSSSGEVGEGLGIGLALVKRLVEMHGGSVAAYSEGPGRGARFEVWLPLAG